MVRIVPTWYFTFPTTAQFGPPYDVPSFNSGNSICFALAEFMAPETSAFLYKTDTVHGAWAGQFNTNYIIFRQVEEIFIFFYEGKIKNLMEYLGIYITCQKFNPRILLIVQQTCAQVAKVLQYFELLKLTKKFCKVRLLQQFPKAISTH